MAVLTIMAGIPLFSTIREALDWGSRNNLRGYHTHHHQGQLGYMGGSTHQRATSTSSNTI